MKNKFSIILLSVIISFIALKAYSEEQFTFDVTEMFITNNGNKFKGSNKGIIKTNDGIVINANEFEYDKILNILNAKGNVKIRDNLKNITINADEIVYYKNDEKIFTKGNSEAENKNTKIKAYEFKYDKILNILNAKGNVEIINDLKNFIIFAEDVTYEKKIEKISTKGLTKADFQSKYKFETSNITLLNNEMELSSSDNGKILTYANTLYKFNNYKYFINNKLLKANKVTINENILLSENETDSLFFENGFFNLGEKSFLAGKTDLKLKKNIFDQLENDPRLSGVSSSGKDGITTINKSIFTSCKKNDNCPPWSISADKITHNKDEKRLIYDNAILRIYNKPVFYFPKFFHPDPSVERQSGFLQPRLNNSNILGSSIQVPYFYAISHDKDLTVLPTIFDGNVKMFQSEYRQENKSSSIIADLNIVQNFKSSIENKKNSITHLFAKFRSDLNFETFIKSELNLNIEKVSNDTYLKIFDSNIQSTLKPVNNNILKSEIKLFLENDNYNLESGFVSFEDLQKKNSDRYEYVFPYYDFSKNFSFNEFGTVELTSSGKNNLSNTNNLKTSIINDVNLRSNDKIFERYGLKNNFNIFLKNLNTSGKNDPKYKESVQSQLMSMFEIQSSVPLKKIDDKYNYFLTPKISLRMSPFNMKNYSNANREINTDNIFDNNRIGMNDSFEEGKSLTVGFNYKKESFNNLDEFVEFDLATIFRDKVENNLPTKSNLNKKSSNIFGSVKFNSFKHLRVDYDFALDNKFQNFEYNSISTNISVNNFVTSFDFIEENGTTGNTNILENTTTYNINDNNFLSFKTRRNRKINLTEYYDLVYEYKNDCLKAGILYKKTYYQDRDLKPGEDLMFTLTLYPLTTFEQKVDTN